LAILRFLKTGEIFSSLACESDPPKLSSFCDPTQYDPSHRLTRPTSNSDGRLYVCTSDNCDWTFRACWRSYKLWMRVFAVAHETYLPAKNQASSPHNAVFSNYTGGPKK